MSARRAQDFYSFYNSVLGKNTDTATQERAELLERGAITSEESNLSQPKPVDIQVASSMP